MNVAISETNEIKTLSIINRETSVEWTRDLIGNAGALSTNENGEVVMSQIEYDWWANYIADIEKTDSDIYELWTAVGDVYSEDAIRNRILAETNEADYETHRPTAVRVLAKIRAEYFGAQ